MSFQLHQAGSPSGKAISARRSAPPVMIVVVRQFNVTINDHFKAQQASVPIIVAA
jgi:hypothetical protein